MRLPALFDRGFGRKAVENERRQVSVVRTFPAPIKGWNKRDPVAAMDPRYAVLLDNWFPRQADCVIRGGDSDHVTGFASKPKTLMNYLPPTSASNKMYAASDTGIYDTTSAGAVGAAKIALTNGLCNWTQMGVSGGHYMISMNGVDKPTYHDGTNWIAVDGVSVPALTGVTTTNLIFPNVYKRRLFVIEKNKLSFWYLAIDSVGGALTEFLLGPLAQRGGFLMAMATWSFDGGDGPDDYAVFITSEGEVLIFKGTDPGVAANWSLVGVFYVGKPIGRKCFKKAGGDLVVNTENGAFPLSRALQSATVDYKLALSNVIEGAFTEAARTLGSLDGWTLEILPSQSALIVNIPTSTTTSKQYVMNTITKAWCSFSGWNAADFIVFNKELYFADQTTIVKAWTGRADKGANIVASAQTAFNNMGSATQFKHWTLFRPMLAVDGNLAFSVGLAIDFNPAPTLSDASYTVTAGAIWDTSLWDVGFWASGLEVKNEWQTPAANGGYWAAGCLRIATNQLEVQWAANDYNYVRGGVLG